MISIRLIAARALAAAVLVAAPGACALEGTAASSADSAALGASTVAPARMFTNPVLPGDHPDMNLFVEGRDFYVTGSDFNMTPNVEILHSTDLVHWERVSRVVRADWPGLQGSIAGGGTWGGFIVKVAAGYRVYFAVNFNQFFAEAPSLAGPWADPVRLNAFPYTVPDGTATFNRGNGYDDSVFIDDDGKTYLVIKAGQCKWNGQTSGQENNFGINLLTQIDPASGMLIADTTLDLSFVNLNVANGGCGDPAGDPAHADTSHWAEGPTLIKRNGFYYYFVTTHTGCGGEEFVWRSPRLTADPADWTPLGRLAANQQPFAGAQHSSAPIQLADGTWWALFHSYECSGGWQGLARQGLLAQVTWTDDGVPMVSGDWATPAPAPDLPASAIHLLTPINDEFRSPRLATGWTFYGHADPASTSVTERPGWLRVKPGTGHALWVVQKDVLHSSAMVTRVDFAPAAPGDAAGVRLGNPIPAEQVSQFDPSFAPRSIELSLARVWGDGGDEIRFALGSFAFSGAPVLTTSAAVPAPGRGPVWLEIVRTQHQATGWMSVDRRRWTQVGAAIDITALDDYDSLVDGWVGNQAGVFASNSTADFDMFSYRDGFTAIPASEPDQRSAGGPVASTARGTVLGGLANGDWVMYAGVDLGSEGLAAHALELTVATGGASREPRIDVWFDRPDGGHLAARCDLPRTGSWERWQTVRCPLRAAGTHDVYLRVRGGTGEVVRLADLRFSARDDDRDHRGHRR